MPLSQDQHPDDSQLDEFARDPKSATADVANHIAECRHCQKHVAFARKLTELAPERTARAGTLTVEAMSAFQFRRRTAMEDAEADRVLEDVIDDPYAFVGARIVRREQNHTGGFVR